MTVTLGISACTSGNDTAYRQEIRHWHKERVQKLMAPDGWLALSGLFWLKEGPNTFGAHPGNPIVFPDKTPDTLGTFWLLEDSVLMQISGKEQVMIDDQPVNSFTLTGWEDPPLVRFEDLSWILIRRTDKYGIRLWDRQHPAIQDTIHIDTYPVDPGWKVPAVWVKDPGGYKIKVRNVLDMEIEMESEGRLRFEHLGNNYELTALDGGPDEFFMIFADATSGDETYPGGRYLYVPRPDSTGHTYLDFNKAYNPPCAFTEFATCLLPPAENRLDLAVKAGELNYGAH